MNQRHGTTFVEDNRLCNYSIHSSQEDIQSIQTIFLPIYETLFFALLGTGVLVNVIVLGIAVHPNFLPASPHFLVNGQHQVAYWVSLAVSCRPCWTRASTYASQFVLFRSLLMQLLISPVCSVLMYARFCLKVMTSDDWKLFWGQFAIIPLRIGTSGRAHKVLGA